MLKSEAIKYFGSSSELAKALGIEPSAVSQWGESIPKLRAFEVLEIKKQNEAKKGNETKPAA